LKSLGLELPNYPNLGLSKPWIIDVIELPMSSSQRRPGTRHAHRIAVHLSSTQILPYVAVNKDAFPTSPAYAAGCIKSVRLPKQAQVSRVIL
jgi:hypothetical protein